MMRTLTIILMALSLLLPDIANAQSKPKRDTTKDRVATKKTNPTSKKNTTTTTRKKTTSNKKQFSSNTKNTPSYEFTVNGLVGDLEGSYDSDGHYETITVNTNGKPWDVKMLPRWCYIQSRTSNSFVLRIMENTGSTPRTDWFNVVCGNSTVKVTLYQDYKRPAIKGYTNGVRVNHQQWIDQSQCMVVTGGFTVQSDYNKTYTAVAFIEDSDGTLIKGNTEEYKLDDGTFFAISPTTGTSATKEYYIIIPIQSFNHWTYTKKLTLSISLFCEETQKYVETSEVKRDFYVKYDKSNVYTTDF